MAKKILRTRTQFTSTLKTELYKELQELSLHTSVPISKLLDRGVIAVLMAYKGKEKGA